MRVRYEARKCHNPQLPVLLKINRENREIRVFVHCFNGSPHHQPHRHTLTPSPSPHRYPTDAVEDEARLRRDLDEEVSELREECEEGRAERVAHYEEQLAEWKTYMRARVRSRSVMSS